MTGRGRGRGTLSKWGETSKPRGELRVVGSSANSVLPLSWKEIKNESDDGQNDSHVRVTHIIDVEHFWAQIGSLDELKQFDTYMLALNLWCNEQQKSGDLQIPQFGQPVCVRHKDTSQWRRAQVTRLSNDMVDVFYLDYGQSEFVSLDRICHSTPGDILSRRAMAQYATLEGVQPVGESWSNEANKRFSELVSAMGDKLTVQFTDNFRARLYLRNGSGLKVAVSDVLISEGLAQRSHNSLGTGSWQKDDYHKAKSLNSEEQKKLDKQWNSLKLLPPTSRESAWNTSTAFTTNKEKISFNTGKQFEGYSPFSQEHTSNTLVQTNCDEMKGGDNTNKTSLNNVTPPLKPDWFEQSSDNLETFNMKKIDPGPVEVLRSSRPHLASPDEFLSHTRGHDAGFSAARITDVKDEPSPKYQPPHLRNASKNKNGIPGKNSEHQLESFSSSSQSNHSSFLKQDDQQSPFSNFTFSPKVGRSHIAAQFQTVAKKEDTTKSFQPQQQKPVETFSQPEFLKVQPLNETTRDEKLRAELEWKIWKFRRNISELLNKIVSTKMVDFAAELDKHIANSRISREFPGISEMSIILSLLLEKALEGDKFHSAAVKVCIALMDMDSLESSEAFGKAVSECQDSLMEQCSVSDCYKRCKRFSSFMGKLYLEVLPDTSDSSFKTSFDGIIANCLHGWLSFDQAELLDIHRLNALCLKTFLEVTGPVIDQTEGNEISRYFGTIRELVLSQNLEISVKGTLLDILLLRASGWKAEEEWDEQQEAASEFAEDEVPSENEVTEVQQQVETGDQSNSAEWDPYSKVRVMLKNLKLEGLLPKFFENCIRDSLLAADWQELKTTLKVKHVIPRRLFSPWCISGCQHTTRVKPAIDGISNKNEGNHIADEFTVRGSSSGSWGTSEAAFPPGVILEIRMYLEKGPRPTTDKKPASSADVVQEVKPKASKSLSPINTVEHSIEISRLNQELQQLMVDDNQEKGLQKTSPTRKISRPPEQADHEESPYSRPVTRKYVSKTERRHSLEWRGDELSQPVKEPVKSASFTSDPTEAKNVGATSETGKEQKQPVSSKSYSAVLKNVSSEAKPGEMPANQSKTLSRPPPGFTALPTHGGDSTMRMTVLGATKSKSRATGPSSSAPRNTQARSDTNMNWRNEPREEQNTQNGTRPQQQQKQQQQKQRQTGHAVKWRQFGDFVQNNPSITESFDERCQRSGMPAETFSNTSSIERTEAPPVVQPHRAFGPGGLKACVICGSKEHLRCNDRSKFFLD